MPLSVEKEIVVEYKVKFVVRCKNTFKALLVPSITISLL